MTFNDVQSLKVPSLIDVTDGGMTIDSNDVHERNAHDPIFCIAFGSWIDFNLSHL